MCGIAGFVSRYPVPAAPILSMTALARHRGPDDEGYVLLAGGAAEVTCAGGGDTPADVYRARGPSAPTCTTEAVSDLPVTVAFGHRRLAITDLSAAGHQPMCTPDRRRWIVFNGAVYNHVELRQELQELGHRFATRTDTEVVLAAYTQWGKDCLRRFNGMWAFAILDIGAGEVFLARDRFGVKPLYYWVAPGGVFCFASEIKQFTPMPGWVPRVNPGKAHDVLVRGLADHSDETLFRGVYQIPGGHATSLRLGTVVLVPQERVPVTAWYTLDPKPFLGSYADAVGEYHRLFQDAVAVRLRTDVPVGAGLSGGLDSSAIVCQAVQSLNETGALRSFPTYTAYAEDPRCDERRWVAAVGKHSAIEPTYICPTVSGLFDELNQVVWHLDEPIGYSSVYAEWSVYRAVGQSQVRVTLEGHGADEMLAGYPSYLFANVAQMLRHGRLPRAIKELARLRKSGCCAAQTIPGTMKFLLPAALVNTGRHLLGRREPKPPWLDASFGCPCAGNPGWNENSPGVRGLSRTQLLHSSLPYQLHSADRNSMAHSVEMRHPFLDYRLVEFALSCPDDFKLEAGVTKRMHRDALRSTMPCEIAARTDKIGFATPEACWAQETAQREFDAAVNEAVHRSPGVLNERVLSLARDMIAGRKAYDPVLWRWIVFGAWMNRFGVTA
jgi:asparagine synthase (glutamine-hydrolysing)